MKPIKANFTFKQTPHYILVKFKQNKAINELSSKDTEACWVPAEKKGDDGYLGDIWFRDGYFDLGNLAHEVTHAAMWFAKYMSDTEALDKMSEDELMEYIEELIPNLAGSLMHDLEPHYCEISENGGA
jgi:hypothetical protein